VTLLHPRVEPTHVDEPDAEALIQEARRLRRRRWVIGLLILAMVVGGGVGWGLTASTGGSVITATRVAAPHATERGLLPEGPYANLGAAGPLAVSPTGALYVTDVDHNQVLVRLANGRFRVVAGDGATGTSGDGGPAINAQFLDISDLAVAPNGSLYIVDGERVRVVIPTGVISTVAGVPGELKPTKVYKQPPPVPNGTPARSTSIGQNGAAIALSEQGELYISTGLQLLRLVDGRLDVIQTRAIGQPFNGGPLLNPGEIAVDAQGNLDVSGGNGWSVWQVAPNGTAKNVVEVDARRSGGNYSVLERAPDGAVYGENGSALLKIVGGHTVSAYAFPYGIGPTASFWLTYFAFGPSGTIYADEIPGGGGFERYQQLRVVRDNRSSVIWQQTRADAARGVS
jgi:hypothetical protein